MNEGTNPCVVGKERLKKKKNIYIYILKKAIHNFLPIQTTNLI